MIKVFTTSLDPNKSGDVLTAKFEEWVATFQPNTIEIITVHSNSNKFGWMLVIHYKIRR